MKEVNSLVANSICLIPSARRLAVPSSIINHSVVPAWENLLEEKRRGREEEEGGRREEQGGELREDYIVVR
jgi:hypothetical protein